jgi:exosome complex component RRP4
VTRLTILVEKRQLVTPGDLIAEGDYVTGESTFKEGDKIYATRIGLVDADGRSVSVVALKGGFIPSAGDLVIGKVIDMSLSGWVVDINAPYAAILHASDAIERPFNPQRDVLTAIYDIGDMILAKVAAYDRTRNPILTTHGPGLGKITRGRIIEIVAAKIPRLIGKRGSMINMLKRETGCHLTIGQNGLILISGKSPEDEDLAVLAIRKIEEEAHTSGLTDRICSMVREENQKRGVHNASS